MKLRPTRDYVVVKRFVIDENAKTAGGLFIPGTAKEQLNEGTIEAVGSGRTLENGQLLPLEVKVGDKVIFAKHNFTEIKHENETYLVMLEDHILAVVEE